MEKRDIDELESEDAWDLAKAERHPAVQARRVIVSVAFSPTDFKQVSEVSARGGHKVSQFIRDAAIERARGTATVRQIVITSGNLMAVYTSLSAPGTACFSRASTNQTPQLAAVSNG